jgi:hypothetical protein
VLDRQGRGARGGQCRASVRPMKFFSLPAPVWPYPAAGLIAKRTPPAMAARVLDAAAVVVN